LHLKSKTKTESWNKLGKEFMKDRSQFFEDVQGRTFLNQFESHLKWFNTNLANSDVKEDTPYLSLITNIINAMDNEVARKSNQTEISTSDVDDDKTPAQVEKKKKRSREELVLARQVRKKLETSLHNFHHEATVLNTTNEDEEKVVTALTKYNIDYDTSYETLQQFVDDNPRKTILAPSKVGTTKDNTAESPDDIFMKLVVAQLQHSSQSSTSTPTNSEVTVDVLAINAEILALYEQLDKIESQNRLPDDVKKGVQLKIDLLLKKLQSIR
jgi:hypothetical protein